MTTTVIFIQGGGEGAHHEDAALVASLRLELGDGFTVDYPEMPDESDPDVERWGAAIGDAISRGSEPIVLVGHSIGGYLLLRRLAAERPSGQVAAICIISAPFPGGDADWTFPGFELPDDLADRLPDAALYLYASEDDEVVPFRHRDLYAGLLPASEVRTTTGGHQLGGELGVVAKDIRAVIREG